MFHPDTADKLMYLLEVLAEKGEEEAFKEVHKLIKEGY